MSERVAIVGTAGSWDMTPWTDTSISIWSLNDAYRIPGFQRADRWFDFHPLNKFVYSQGPMYAHQIPPGHYCRPQGHLEWLAQQTIPIYLHPEYCAQHPEAVNWKHARPFPKAEIEAHFGRYFTSSPGWMMAQAILEGAREIHIYGIHLSTEFEYMKQRPNFEFLIGCVLGSGKRTMTVKDGLRYYESQNGLIVLPEQSPVMQENFQYAFEPRPDGHLELIKWELHKIGMKRTRAQVALNNAHWLNPIVTLEEVHDGGKTVKTRLTRSALKDRMIYLEAVSEDWTEQLKRAEMAGAI